MLNLNVLAAATGNEKEIATNLSKIRMPKIVIVPKGTAQIDLTATGEDYVAGTCRVNALGNNGAMGKSYEISTEAADANHFYISGDTLTLPTDTTADKFVVKYDRDSDKAVKVTNSSDKFPSTVKLTLKVLVIDPCHPDEVKSAYIIIPSFQVSPEVNITINTEGTLDYTGSMQVDYCGDDKELYTIVMSEDDSEE